MKLANNACHSLYYDFLYTSVGRATMSASSAWIPTRSLGSIPIYPEIHAHGIEIRLLFEDLQDGYHRMRGFPSVNGRTLDAALVSPGSPTPFPNVRHQPDMSKGMTFNLANNIWGTNYVMWQPYGGLSPNQRFRFELQMRDVGQSVLPS